MPVLADDDVIVPSGSRITKSLHLPVPQDSGESPFATDHCRDKSGLAECRVAVSADGARMYDLARLDRTHVGRVEVHDGNGIARQSRELNFIACALLMHQHNGTNITSS
jgi:hypothetical protein